MNRFNEWLAVRATMIFGSMWVTYLLFFYGFVPVLFPREMNTLLYWSNTIQLWSLPLLMVGQNVMGRSSDKRAQETHDAVMEELERQRNMNVVLIEEMAEIKAIHHEQNQRHAQMVEALQHLAHPEKRRLF